jgi:hypothetical protein
MQNAKVKKEASNGQPQTGDPQLKENPAVNEKIDGWINDNPKRWEYFSSLPPDRMRRMLVLHEIDKTQRRENMHNGIMKKLEGDPEAKQAYDTLLKKVPEGERERAMVTVARQVLRVTTPREPRSKQQLAGAGVKV